MAVAVPQNEVRFGLEDLPSSYERAHTVFKSKWTALLKSKWTLWWYAEAEGKLDTLEIEMRHYHQILLNTTYVVREHSAHLTKGQDVRRQSLALL